MKKMWKRFVSLLLACTLLAGMLPLSASAASEPTEDSQWITEKIKEINAGLEPDEQYHRGNYYKLGDSDLYRLTFTRTIDTETATITVLFQIIIHWERRLGRKVVLPPSTSLMALLGSETTLSME